jgi:hypothetical protein
VVRFLARERDDFPPSNVQNGSVAHLGSNLIGARGWGSWSVNLTIHLHLVLKLRMSVVTLLIFLHASALCRGTTSLYSLYDFIFETKVYRRILDPVYDNEKENWRLLTNKEIYAGVKKTYYNRGPRVYAPDAPQPVGLLCYPCTILVF